MHRLFIFLTGSFFLVFSASAQEIALTFDDAPMADGPYYPGIQRTQVLIRRLREASVKQCAFFAIGSRVAEAGTERLKQYAAAGHLIGNHTYSHRWIKEMGVNNYVEDIRKADQILRDLPGFIRWFRYPFLDEGRTREARDTIRIALSQMQYANGYVTIDNYDWYLNSLFQKALLAKKKVDYDKLRQVYLEHVWNSIQFYNGMAQQVLGRSPKHVLLLHENDLAALFIKDLVQLLRQKGWKVISPTEAFQDPISTIIPDVLFNGQGRVAAIADEKGIPRHNLVQDAEDEAYLDAYLVRMKVFQ
jgi:peptidoglycan-N-acetylglucosamine deacetylase